MRQITLDELGRIAANSREDLWAEARNAGLDHPVLVLHWTAGWYDSFYPDEYHVEIGEHGEILLSTEDLSEILPHTEGLNRGAVAVSMCCCGLATTNNLGEEPPTYAQIETMAKVIAVLCANLWLSIRKDIVATHGEFADDPEYFDEEDMYGPNNDCWRWDLQFLGTPESPYYTADHDDPHTGGNVLRRKALEYQQQWNQEAVKV